MEPDHPSKSLIDAAVHSNHSVNVVETIGGSSFCLLCAIHRIHNAKLSVQKLQVATTLLKVVSTTTVLVRVASSSEFVQSCMNVLINELSAADPKEIGSPSLQSVLLSMCPLLAPYCHSFPKCFFDICVQCQTMNWRQCRYLLRALGILLQHRSCVEVFMDRHRDFISHLRSGLDYPDEEIKSEVCFVLLKVVSVPDGMNAIQDMASVLCRSLVEALINSHYELLRTHATGLLYAIISSERSVLLETLLEHPISSALKTLILATSLSVQISAAHIVSIISAKSDDATRLLSSDITDFLVEAMNTKSDVLLGSIFVCFSQFCSNEEFYKNSVLDILLESTLQYLSLQTTPMEVKIEALQFLNCFLDFIVENLIIFQNDDAFISCWQMLESKAKKILSTMISILEKEKERELQETTLNTITKTLACVGADIMEPSMHSKLILMCIDYLTPNKADGLVCAILEVLEQLTRGSCSQVNSQALHLCEKSLLPLFLIKYSSCDDSEVFSILFTIFSNLVISNPDIAGLLAKQGMLGKSLTMLNLFHEKVLVYPHIKMVMMNAILQYNNETWPSSVEILPATEQQILSTLEQKGDFTLQDETSELQAMIISLLYCCLLFDDTTVIKCNNISASLYTFLELNSDIKVSDELARQIVFTTVYCNSKSTQKPIKPNFGPLIPFIVECCDTFSFATHKQATIFVVKWLLKQDSLFDQNKKMIVNWLLSVEGLNSMENLEWVQLLVEEGSSSIKLLVSLLSQPCVEWIDPLLGVIYECASKSPSSVAHFIFHNAFSEIIRLLTIRAHVLQADTLRLISMATVSILQGLVQNDSIDSQASHIQLANQIATQIIKFLKTAVQSGESVGESGGVLLHALNCVNMLHYSNTLVHTKNSVLWSDYQWLVTISIAMKDFRIASGAIVLLVQLLRFDSKKMLEHSKSIFVHVLSLLDSNTLPILKVLVCNYVAEHIELESTSDLSTGLFESVSCRDLFSKVLNIFFCETDEVIRCGCVKLLGCLTRVQSDDGENLIEQPWVRYTVDTLINTNDKLSLSEIRFISTVLEQKPYWVYELIGKNNNVLTLQLARSWDAKSRKYIEAIQSNLEEMNIKLQLPPAPTERNERMEIKPGWMYLVV